MSGRRLSSANLTTIIVTLLGTIGSITTAYFVLRGNIAPIEMSLNATQTAAASIAVISSLSPTTATFAPDISTPLAPESSTPSLSPSQSIESPAPTPVVLFGDSFSNNANNWRIGSREAGIYSQNIKLTDGALQFEVDFHGKGYSWVTVPDFQEENADISIDTEMVQFSTRSVAGVVILFRISNGGNTAYAIEFINDGRVGLYSSKTLRQDGLWHLIHEEHIDTFQITENTVNNYRIKVLGQRFTAYVNGNELFTFEDNSIKGTGDVAIGLSGESNKSAIARFDNLLITK